MLVWLFSTVFKAPEGLDEMPDVVFNIVVGIPDEVFDAAVRIPDEVLVAVVEAPEEAPEEGLF